MFFVFFEKECIGSWTCIIATVCDYEWNVQKMDEQRWHMQRSVVVVADGNIPCLASEFSRKEFFWKNTL